MIFEILMVLLPVLAVAMAIERMRQSKIARYKNPDRREEMAIYAMLSHEDPDIERRRREGAQAYWRKVRSGEIKRTIARNNFGQYIRT